MNSHRLLVQEPGTPLLLPCADAADDFASSVKIATDFDTQETFQAPTAEDLNVESPPESPKRRTVATTASKVDAVERRYRIEGWTTYDLYAAYLQSSLLCYRSAPDSEDRWPKRTRGNKPYIKSEPDDYTHNCPWNDWMPPSKSQELFHAAADKAFVDPVKKRVRVRLCNPSSPESIPVIGFATIETDGRGIKRLRLRRGSEVLVYWSIATLEAKYVDELLVLSPKVASPAAPTLYLKFEDHARFDRFCRLFLPHLTQ